jgi:hypothetical protein
MSVENTVPPMITVKILKKIKPSIKCEDHRIMIPQTISSSAIKNKCSRGRAKKSTSHLKLMLLVTVMKNIPVM